MANKPPLIWLNITIFAVSFVLAAVVALGMAGNLVMDGNT